METTEKRHRKGKKTPKVPIKTYKWEEVYRSRSKGGYPWTHLYKEPFDDELYPEHYTMEALRRSKSSSTFDRSDRSEGVEIEEIFEDDRSNISTAGSARHGEVDEPEDESPLKNHKEEEKRSQIFTIESAESSDNISQYLDKEEPGPNNKENVPVAKDENKDRQERACSEEVTRKRRHSGESSYSRISLPKLALLRKKIPKINFPTSKLKRTKINKSKKSSPPQVKKDTKSKPKDFKDVKPVYIHIPLRPPPGETDEFSYLEFEAKKEKPPTEPAPNFKSLVQAIKKAKEQQKKEALKSEQTTPEVENTETEEIFKKVVTKPKEIMENVEIEAEKTPEEKMEIEEIKTENKSEEKMEIEEIEIERTEDDSTEEPIKDVETIPELKEEEHDSEDSAGPTQEELFDKLFAAGPSTTDQSTKIHVRAKSAEPEKKRKMSLESSYSRKSLSKLAFLKKIQNAKNKIKFPSLSSLIPKKFQTKEEKPAAAEEVKDKKEKKVSKKEDKLKPKVVEPVYIHIPLKPPEGQSDEFSYLENEENISPVQVKNEPDKEQSPGSLESPVSVQADGVQFIFLTAPSDDEILDSADVPETPSSNNSVVFFGNRIEELKELAKDAVNEVSPDSKRKKLDPVTEEPIVEEVKDTDKEETIVEEVNQEFDQEDGLKITNVEKDGTKAEIKSSLKQESSPVLRKKVSFKRRSKDSKEEDYEEIQTKSADDNVLKLEAVKPKIVEEIRKVEEQIDVMHPEEETRWSKSSDHEYEPVNPPPEEPKPQPILKEKPKETPEDHSFRITESPTSLPQQQIDQTRHEDVSITHETLPRVVTMAPTPQIFPSESVEEEETTPPPQEGKFQTTLKLKAGQLKTRLQKIKKPHITLPNRPKFQKPNLQKFKLDKCKFNLPKIPDTTRINLPSFGRSTTTKQIIKQRQLSTESNAGDSKKHTFDFKTYPRIFKKKRKSDVEVERSKSAERDMPQESLQSNPSSETRKINFDFMTYPRFFKKKKQEEKVISDLSSSSAEERRRSAEASVRIPLHYQASTEEENDENPPRYDEQQHSFEDSENHNEPSLIRYSDDIDVDDDYDRDNLEPTHDGFKNRWEHGSFKVTDLDSPGHYSESFDINANAENPSSESSLEIHRRGVLEEINPDEFFLRQKGISQDNIEVGKYLSSEIREAFKTPVNTLSEMQRDNKYNYGSNQSLPEAQSQKKKPVRKPKRKKTPHVSNEQIKHYDLDADEPPMRPKRTSSKNLNEFDDSNIMEILKRYDDGAYQEHKQMYENEQMEGKEQPEIFVDDISEPVGSNQYRSEQLPAAPPRKHKSLKSLNLSEHESILGDFGDRKLETEVDEYIDDDDRSSYKIKPSSYYPEESELPQRPRRSKGSKQSSRSTSQVDVEPPSPQEVIEEPCVRDIRDCMGYAIIDKSKGKDPPLPPPRTPPRRRRSMNSGKFSTVPRSSNEPPMRPLRNYSTLGQIRRNRENQKENVDITQYIEVDDDANRNLSSGEVVQKMRDRPLPPPPRPPRKSKPLKDITSQQNIACDSKPTSEKDFVLEETEVSTQTDPLPDDFICEEEIIPEHTQQVESQIEEPMEKMRVRRHLEGPTHYTFEETVTHGSLLVEPLNGAKILDDSELSRSEKIIPVHVESEDEYPSKVPEYFKNLKDPEEKIEKQPQKIQVSDLDVNRLTVNELLASKIVVSEIDSDSIRVNQITSNQGPIKIGEIELPKSAIEELLKNAQTKDVTAPEKKLDVQENVPTSHVEVEEIIRSSPIIVDEIICEKENIHSSAVQEEDLVSDGDSERNQEQIPPTPPPRNLNVAPDVDEAPPQRPPRQSKTDQSDNTDHQIAEPDVDDYPPPRPPQPDMGYLPSQPPASFYALRAQKYVMEENIPAAPRRRRHHQRPRSRSSSEDSVVVPVSRRHFRTSDPSISQLTGQLIRACGSAGNNVIKRLITHIKDNVLRNEDGQQDLHVIMIILLVLIAGLLLIGYGDEKTVVHMHHWEYFNPPKDM